MTGAPARVGAKPAILVIAHGTVDELDELPAFLANIRRGHPAPPELEAEVRRRYQAIGGRSPLAAITREVAAKLEAKLGVTTRVAMRLWRPYPRDVLAALAGEGCTRIVVLPLAQHSAAIYGESVKKAASHMTGGAKLQIVCAENWGRLPALTRAYAAEVRRALDTIPESDIARTCLVLTAHSLPLSIIQAGDPYEVEVRASAEAIMRELGPSAPLPGVDQAARQTCRHLVAFQSQGMGTSVEWLGPDIEATLDAIAAHGDKRVVVAPIGFLADHVEILYDLDIEAKGWAKARGLELTRTRSLNTEDAFIDALAEVARPLLGGTP